MHPVLLTFGPLTIYTFGLFLVLGFISALFVIWLFARREGFSEEKIFDLCLFSSIFGFLGGRLGFFLAHPRLFCPSCFFRFSLGGFSYLSALFSGFLACFLALRYFAKKSKIEFSKVFDLLVIGLSLGEGFGYLGCFLSGTAYGKETSFFWGVAQVGLLGRRHPVQLLFSLSSFSLFYLLLRLGKKRHFAGFLGLFYLIFRSWSFFLLDFLKEGGVYLKGLKSSQWLGLFLGSWGLVYLYRREKRDLRKDLENLFSVCIEKGGRFYLALSFYIKKLKRYGQSFKTFSSSLSLCRRNKNFTGAQGEGD